MNNIENLLEKIKKDKIAHTLVDSIESIPKDNRLAVLEKILDEILLEKIRSFQNKRPKDEN